MADTITPIPGSIQPAQPDIVPEPGTIQPDNSGPKPIPGTISNPQSRHEFINQQAEKAKSVVGNSDGFGGALSGKATSAGYSQALKQNESTNQGASAVGRAVNSGLANVGNAMGTLYAYGVERQERNFAEGKNVFQHGSFDTQSQKIWSNPRLSFSQKLDQVGQNFVYGSPGYLQYWGKPGEYEKIMAAEPNTPAGNLAKLVYGRHANFVRWEAQHPDTVGPITFAESMIDPTQWLAGEGLGAAAHGISAAAHVAGEAGTVARAAAEAKTAGLAVRPAENANAMIKAATALGQKYPEQVKALGAAYEHVSKSIGPNLPVIADRYHNMAREYGVKGAQLHHKMTFDYVARTNANETMLKSNDYGGGLGSKPGATTDGSDPKQLNDMQQVRHLVEHMNDIKAGGLNPKAQKQLESLQQQLHDLQNSPIDPAKNETPELRQGKIQHVQQQIAYINKTQRVEVTPDMHMPINGVSKMDRAENFSKLFMDKFEAARQKFPVTADKLMGPEIYGYDDEKGLPQRVMTFWPHKSTYDLEGIPEKGSGAGGGAASPSLIHRQYGKVSEAVTRPPNQLDLNGNPTGIPGREPMKLSKHDNPLGDVLNTLNAWDTYETMIDHFHGGRALVHLKTGKAAVLPVEYGWKGDERLAGAEIELNGQKVPLDKPRNLGKGPQGAKNAENFAKAAAPFRQRARLMSEGSELAHEDVVQSIYDDLTRDFRSKNPTHVPPGTVLHTPDLDGWASERTFLEAVADANPALRWKGMSESYATRAPKETERLVQANKNTAWSHATTSGVTPDDFISTHFSGAHDDIKGTVGKVGQAWDAFSSLAQASVLYNPVFHPIFNTAPAIFNLMMEHAGPHPAKLIKYASDAASATIGAMVKATDDVLGGAADALNHSIEERFGVKGPNAWATPRALFQKADVGQEWYTMAQEHGAHVPQGVRKMGMTPAEYVRVFSSPFEELPPHERFLRDMSSAASWNQRMTFDVMESRMIAQAMKTLVKHEKMAPEAAARAINKAINDYHNLTGIERDKAFQRLTWFYPFMKMQIRRAAVLYTKRPQVLVAQNRAIQAWNSSHGDSNAPENQIVVGRDSKGQPKLGSVQFGPYRYASLLADLTGLGGGDSVRKSVEQVANRTSPLGDLLAHGLAQGFNALIKRGVDPNAYNFTTGLSDETLPWGDQAQQAAGMLAGKIEPSFMEKPYVNYTKPQLRMIYQGQDRMRTILNSKTASPLAKKNAAEILMQLDNLDAGKVLQAAARANALYSGYKGDL